MGDAKTKRYVKGLTMADPGIAKRGHPFDIRLCSAYIAISPANWVKYEELLYRIIGKRSLGKGVKPSVVRVRLSASLCP